MRPTLFLDIDGVLNNGPSMQKYGSIAEFHSAIFQHKALNRNTINFDSVCVDLVKNLVHKYNMKVVISSNWRFNAHPKHFIELFKLYDWHIDTISLIDTWIADSEIGVRSKLIEKYINENDVRQYIMVDDTSTHYDRARDRLILTDMRYGFNQESFDQAIQLLME